MPIFYRTKPKECRFVYQSQISEEHLHSLNPRTLNPECHKLRTFRDYDNLCICLTPRNPVLHSLYKVPTFLGIFILGSLHPVTWLPCYGYSLKILKKSWIPVFLLPLFSMCAASPLFENLLCSLSLAFFSCSFFLKKEIFLSPTKKICHFPFSKILVILPKRILARFLMQEIK